MWVRGWAYQALTFLGLLITRLAFLWWNKPFLAPDAPLSAVWLRGIGFDWVAATWICLPAWLSLLVGWPKLALWLWRPLLALLLALEVIDVGYFPYTHRRSGPELLEILSFWQDSLPALGKYVRDFSAGFLFWGLLAAGLGAAGGYVNRLPPAYARLRLFGWAVSIGILGISARGGLRLKPLFVVDAALEGCPTCTPFVLNTTFFFVRTLQQPPLPPWPKLPPDVLPYPRLWQADPQYAFAPRHNVIILILESLSQAYLAQGYAPFLDSLLRQGATVRWGFATNSRSAEGIPAILSSFPSWGEEPLIFTPYASRIQNSLAEILQKWGYTTAFFHGGNNGTMVLDSYAKQAGFRHYFGRREYPYPDRDYDGTWGIWDEPFLQFCADQLDRLPEPFLAVIFTLSSHHPYAIPAELQDSFPPGPLPIHRAIRYTDWALRRFFSRISSRPWTQRTLFVFTADHTGPLAEPYQVARQFHVPIGFYLIGKAVPAPDTLASQIDILPSVLEAVGYPHPVPIWGRSVWHKDSLRWAPQKPLPFLLQAIGPGYLVQRTLHGELTSYRWKGSPYELERTDTLPPWWDDWISYLASYGLWLQKPQMSPARGRTTTSSTTTEGGK
ncbi:MAG: LTA synthase family protein [Bacteroidia bacterium]